MELKIRSKAKKYAKVLTFVPLALSIVLGCVWWISDRAVGYSTVLGGIALTPIVWLVLRAIVKELDGVEWVVSSSGVTIRKKNEDERTISWDSIAKVEMAGSGVNLHVKPTPPAEEKEEGESKDQTVPQERPKKELPLEEVRIGFVAELDAAVVAACHQDPSVLDDDGGKEDDAPIVVGPTFAQKVTKGFAAAVCVALGAYAGGRGIGAVLAHLETKSWPTTPALVTKADIVDQELEDSKRVIKKLDIEYVYQVEGETHRSSRVTAWSSDLAGFEEVAKDYLDKYPTDTEVDIYYDPANPKYAVITPGAHSVVSTAGIVVGLPLFVIGILIHIYLLTAYFEITREIVKDHLASKTA